MPGLLVHIPCPPSKQTHRNLPPDSYPSPTAIPPAEDPEIIKYDTELDSFEVFWQYHWIPCINLDKHLCLEDLCDNSTLILEEKSASILYLLCSGVTCNLNVEYEKFYASFLNAVVY